MTLQVLQGRHRVHPVVIVGGGYAGVLAANRIAGRAGGAARVVLVSDREEFVHRVRLHELASGGAPPRYPLSTLLRRGVEHVHGRVERALAYGPFWLKVERWLPGSYVWPGCFSRRSSERGEPAVTVLLSLAALAATLVDALRRPSRRAAAVRLIAWVNLGFVGARCLAVARTGFGGMGAMWLALALEGALLGAAMWLGRGDYCNVQVSPYSQPPRTSTSTSTVEPLTS